MRLLALPLAALLALSSTALRAQSTGIVNGTVVDGSTGKYLEGAEVSVDGTALHTVTAREGDFTLLDVPAGARTLTVSYPGLETKRKKAYRMKLHQLRYLAAVAQSGLNITAAAQKLHTSQPGISKQIQFLERELGVELFVALAAILSIFVFAGWRMHWRQLRARLAGGGGRHPLVRLREEGLVIESGPATPMIEWPRIREIRLLEDVWLLLLATNHFIVLPVRGAPREALQFLQEKVRAASAT